MPPARVNGRRTKITCHTADKKTVLHIEGTQPCLHSVNHPILDPMKFESVLELKQQLVGVTLRRMMTARTVVDMAVRSRRMAGAAEATLPGRAWMRGLILGVGMKEGGKGFTLAVRVQDRQLMNSPLLDEIASKAKGEVDVRYTGSVRSLAAKKKAARTGHWYRKRIRPLEIGTSIAHKDVTAGTIGAFVKKGRDGAWYILSNNHVLANVNDARIGDEILQPGPADGGRLREADIVAHLSKFVPISFTRRNAVDCAIAKVKEGVSVIADRIHGLGEFRGPREEDVEIHMDVQKLGRTTGRTKGRISAVALDDVSVDMETGIAVFDNQIEIESTHPTKPFCLGGDSGSVIFDSDNRAAALLFAGSEEGGAGNLGLTFANPIAAVISALGIRFEV